MRNIVIVFTLFLVNGLKAQNDYVPSSQVLETRAQFQNMKFGLFIHWGVFSIPGDGEWVMNNRKIRIHEYAHLKDFFYPLHYKCFL